MAGEKPTPIFRSEADLARLPASDRIRYRLIGADCRYHANDNIAEHIEPGEIDELQAEVEAKMKDVLREMLPYYVPLVITLLLITYFPAITTAIPRWALP